MNRFRDFLWFGFPNFSAPELKNSGTLLILKAKTVSGQDISIATTITELMEKSSRRNIFFAGLENPSPIKGACKENQSY
jgi:hypothetical protein